MYLFHFGIRQIQILQWNIFLLNVQNVTHLFFIIIPNILGRKQDLKCLQAFYENTISFL